MFQLVFLNLPQFCIRQDNLSILLSFWLWRNGSERIFLREKKKRGELAAPSLSQQHGRIYKTILQLTVISTTITGTKIQVEFGVDPSTAVLGSHRNGVEVVEELCIVHHDHWISHEHSPFTHLCSSSPNLMRRPYKRGTPLWWPHEFNKACSLSGDSTRNLKKIQFYCHCC